MWHYFGPYKCQIIVQIVIGINFCISISTDSLERYDIPPISGKISEFDLIKCICQENEVLDDKLKCIPNEDNFVEYIASFDPFEILSIDIKELKNVSVSNGSFSKTCSLNGKKTLKLDNIVLAKYDLSSEIKLFQLTSGHWFDDFCVEHTKNSSGIFWEAFACVEQAIARIPTCCDHGHIMKSNHQCYVDEYVQFLPPMYMGESLTEHVEILQIYEPKQNCSVKSFDLSYSVEGDAALLYNDHNVILKTSEAVVSENFCVTIFKNDTSNDYSYKVFEWHNNGHLKCNSHSSLASEAEASGKCEMITYWLNLPLLIISSVFLTVILIFYALLFEMRKTLGSKMILCHMVSLLVGFITLIILHIPQDANCKVFGPIVQLSFLSSCFWLNVMCFDMWLKLRCIRPSGQSEANARNRFVMYSFYGWGCPIAITIGAIVMDNVIDPMNNKGWIVPGWGVVSCMYVDSAAAMLYYFGPIAVLMTTNLIWFAWVFATLVKANITSGKILKSNTTPSHRRFWIYIKIFFMMGVTWIFEYISWQEGTCVYWIATDIINALRGVILFVIMFGNRETLNKINEKLTVVNERVHASFTSSVNNLRKLSLVSSHSQTVETRIESRRTSEIGNELKVPNTQKMRKERSSDTLNKISAV